MVAGPAQGLHAPTALRPSPLSVAAMSHVGLNPPADSGGAQQQQPGPPHAMLGMPPSLGMSMGMALAGAAGAGGGALGRAAEPLKRKRGRPRKYVGTDPAATAGGAASSPVNMQLALQPPVAGGSTASPRTPASEKRGRGRPPGSGKKQQLASLGSSAGQSFTPHIITVAAGEDVANKIMSFAQHGPRAVCVMSANGAISNVTLRQQSSSGGNVTYEGRYEILSLMGSFLPTDTGGGSRQRTGGLSVSLAGSDGRVIGGGVAGLLMAASPIQVVVGSFISDTGKTPSKAGNGQEPSIGLSPAITAAAATPPSALRLPKNEQKSTPGHHQAVNVQPQSNQASGQPSQLMGLFQPMGGWANPALGEARRADINITLPGG